MRFYDFLTTPELCGDEFTGESWAVHREVMARLWDGDAHLIPAAYRDVASTLLGTDVLPREAPDELYLAFGRGSGKTRFLAAVAVHAWAETYPKLSPGEWATISCHCPSKRQASEWLGYAEGLIRQSPALSAEAIGFTSEGIESQHFTRLQVSTANFRNVRGFTSPLALIDEAAYLMDEFSASPDRELRNALMGCLGRPGVDGKGRLLVASSLHRRTGLMYEMHRQFFGKVA